MNACGFKVLACDDGFVSLYLQPRNVIKKTYGQRQRKLEEERGRERKREEERGRERKREEERGRERKREEERGRERKILIRNDHEIIY